MNMNASDINGMGQTMIYLFRYVCVHVKIKIILHVSLYCIYKSPNV